MNSIAFFCLLLALAASYLNRLPRWVSPAFGFAAALLLLIQGIIRSLEIGFPALTSSYEALLFFALSLTAASAILFLITRSAGIYRLGLALALVLLILASSPLFPDAPHPPIPALRSHWLVLHVALAFLGESLFALAFIASVLWFIRSDEEKKKQLDRLVYRTILIGYPLYTVGALICGAVWASVAWGRFWGWDPKETWALITWLTYTFYLHARFVAKAGPRKRQLISIIGFIFTLVTFLGMNLIAPAGNSLHGY